jgi:uncharacterized ion transporter superfamily protein YfcC
MAKFRVPNTYVIIFFVLLLCAVSTWFVPGSVPQTWQVLSALYEGFSQQAGIIAFVLIIGGAFWVVNSTRAVDAGITKFLVKARELERFAAIRWLGVGNIVMVLIMLLFGLFGAVFGMSEETIAFVAVVIPIARSLGYDEFIAVCMVYVAAHVGFAGAMLNPFTVGIAQDMSSLPLFSGIEYRTFCWCVLMLITIAFVLWMARRTKKNSLIENASATAEIETVEETPAGIGAWMSYVGIIMALVLFSVNYAADCAINIGKTSFETPWLMWVMASVFAVVGLVSIRKSKQMFILTLLMFTIIYMVIGVMGYGWYLPEICALFIALGLAAGISAGYSSDNIAKEFVNGAKDIFSAALIIGFAAGIIVILKNGNVIDPMLESMAAALDGSGRTGALAGMYGIQTFINLFIPSASAKAAVTMPIMAPFSDMIGVSRQATVLAFQFGDGFTNMITPCSGVLMAVLSVARIPYGRWFGFIWKFILALVVVGFLLLLPTLFLSLSGF